MYITKHVDLPEPLVSAQRDGRLVVFAGAGVSMTEPSDLPGFAELASRVAGPLLAAEAGEDPDAHLGRLEEQGVDVQARVREIIDDPHSRPTPLHGHLLKLFPTAEEVRLVTTNFDRHFTSAAEAEFGQLPDRYYGPALPLGRDLQGIVYLHGAVEKHRNHLVLTDRDFGRAYLVDAWATRMLREMFQDFTVLFVGYSHNDVVMEYLARGLVRDTRRYAFTSSPANRQWRRLDIAPVTYPVQSGPDRHSALREAVDAWGQEARRGALAHEARIKDIVGESPPLEPDISDYIKSSLRDPVRLRFFVTHAQTPDWLEWLDGIGALEVLFHHDASMEETTWPLAWWVAERFAVNHPVESLSLVARRGGVLGPQLWRALTGRLARSPRPPADVFARWVALLVQSAARVEEGPEWALTPLLTKRLQPDDRDAALLLFRHLTRPRCTYEHFIGPQVQQDKEGVVQVRAEAVVEDQHELLKTAWRDVFLPNLETLHREIAQIVEAHLSEAHRLLKSLGAASEKWDPTSYGRSAIEPHGQDPVSRGVDVLIDAARDTLAWTLAERPTVAAAMISEWKEADAPVLRRLAINGIAEDPGLEPDGALRQIIEQHWLFTPTLKHEVFRLIQLSYPRAHQSVRKAFVDHAMSEPVFGHDVTGDAEAQETEDYERYNVAVWLRRVAPACRIAERHLATLQEAHPEFGPREYPDLDSYGSPVVNVVPQSPVTAEQLLEKPAIESLDLLLTFKGERWTGPSREGLLRAVREAVERVPAWGLDLAEAGWPKDQWRPDIGESIVRGWNAATLVEELWERVLKLLEHAPNVYSVARSVTDLLESRLKDGSFPSILLPRVEAVAQRIFTTAAESSESPKLDSDGNWVTVAINHPAGKVAEVWLQLLARCRADSGDSWERLPKEHRDWLQSTVNSATSAGALARTIFGSQLAFFYSLDSEWTSESLIPLFDWDTNADTAVQVWHGFLTWGRLNKPLLAALMPFFEQAFAHLDGELQPLRNSFCQRLAAITLQPDGDPMGAGWLPLFILNAGEESRVAWAEAVLRQLSTLDADRVRSMWERWISTYWMERLTGSPKPLAVAEISRMVGWALVAKPVFGAAVELVCRAKAQISVEGGLLFRFKSSSLPEDEAEDFACLLEHLLASTDDLPYHCPELEALVGRLIASGADHEVLARVCDHLARLGCPGASDLEEKLGE